MAALTIRNVSRRSGLSEPTLRYYEEIGLIGPIARDESSGHRRYRTEDLDELQILACMRALGVGIEDMRVYQANRARGHSAAAEQRDLLLRHAERIEAEIAAQYARLGYLATPFPAVQPEDPDELIVPARDGTLRVLRAARDAGTRRVVLTSSFAAIGYSPKPGADKHGAEYTEEDWTDPDTPGLPPYPKSKAIAERAAWDFMRGEGGGTELVVVNPTFILGPTLTSGLRSSLQLVKGMLDGTLTTVRRQRFGVADVRDVADLHIRAMAAPGAAGQRFLCLCDGPVISFLDLAGILRRRLGPLGERVKVQEEAGQDPPSLVIHNERARTQLGWRPRPLETVIVESAESLRDLGLLA